MMERLIEVYYDPDLQRYSISSRASKDHHWATYEGSETELDELLAIARDTMTSG
jgi:hypothetical protein